MYTLSRYLKIKKCQSLPKVNQGQIYILKGWRNSKYFSIMAPANSSFRPITCIIWTNFKNNSSCMDECQVELIQGQMSLFRDNPYIIHVLRAPLSLMTYCICSHYHNPHLKYQFLISVEQHRHTSGSPKGRRSCSPVQSNKSLQELWRYFPKKILNCYNATCKHSPWETADKGWREAVDNWIQSLSRAEHALID